VSIESVRASRARALRQLPSPGRLVLVIGPPCSGKTTYVATHAAPDDVVIDVDALAQALGSPAGHDHHPHHLAAALAARDALVTNSGAWSSTTWLITTNRRTLGNLRLPPHEVVVLDTSIDDCLTRARAAGRTPQVLEAIRTWTP
jgi:hypothetical protein